MPVNGQKAISGSVDLSVQDVQRAQALDRVPDGKQVDHSPAAPLEAADPRAFVQLQEGHTEQGQG